MENRSAALRIALILSALALLPGCTSSAPPATRYLLPIGGAGTGASDTADASAGIGLADAAGQIDHTLVIQPLRLAGYLDTPGIVLQLDDITLNEASGHRWAEDLALQLQRGLRQRLDGSLSGTRVLSGVNLPDARELRVMVESFHGRHDGVAVAAGNWQLRDAAGGLLVQESFAVETPLEADGYPALVRALGRSWDEVADRIARRIIDSR